METQAKSTINMKKLLLGLSCAMLGIGNCGGPLLTRLYFVHGGSRIWLSTLLLTAAWPINLLPIVTIYVQRRRHPTADSTAKLFSMRPRLLMAGVSIGVLTGLSNYFYAFGVARIPVSTSSLIIATQLVFTAGFAFLLVRQRFTPYSVNAVMLLTVGALVLGLHASGDRPKNESKGKYFSGFFMSVVAAATYGLVLPSVEMTYKKAKQVISFPLVLEFQLVMSFSATVFCIIGMLVNHDFEAMPREARKYELGEGMYWIVLIVSTIIWQFFFMGTLGVIFCASSLLSAVIIAVLLPVTEILAVIFYKEKFQVEKGIALALSLWGFVSYFYGEIKSSRKKEKINNNEAPPQIEMPPAESNA